MVRLYARSTIQNMHHSLPRCVLVVSAAVPLSCFSSNRWKTLFIPRKQTQSLLMLFVSIVCTNLAFLSACGILDDHEDLRQPGSAAGVPCLWSPFRIAFGRFSVESSIIPNCILSLSTPKCKASQAGVLARAISCARLRKASMMEPGFD